MIYELRPLSHALLVRLSQALIVVVSLFLEHLESPLESFVLCSMLRALAHGSFGISMSLLEAINLLFENVVLLLEGGDLVLFLKVLLLEVLDFRLQLFHFGGRLIGFDAQSIHSLQVQGSAARSSTVRSKFTILIC